MKSDKTANQDTARKTRRTLKLERETLRRLTHTELKSLRGGFVEVGWPSTTNPNCGNSSGTLGPE